ncbi:hypothetical protein N665_0788s0005 [Sinapis alba]|nr:hypothetical protein N665_0788s0005 [Sinapis alba]
MQWGNLPQDLIEEILYRVPAKSLSQFRSTSKQWHSLLKSTRFAKKHSACAQKEEPLSIMLIDYRVFLVRINLHGFHDNVAPSVNVAYQFNLNSSQVAIRNLFHCDGLLLCTTKDKRLVVWNPCSGETKWVKLRDSYETTDYYALGYDKKSSCKQYKVLRMDLQVILPINNEFEIYDFTTNSWRVLGVATDWFLSQYCHGVSVKGNTYWIATQVQSPHAEFLLSFDFSTERFQNLSLPQPFPFNISALSVVKDEQLCLLGGFYTEDTLHVWVKTSPDESVMSWSKVLTVKAKSGINNNGFSFLADEENKSLVYCNHYMNHSKILHIVGGDKVIQVDPLDLSSTIIPSCPLLLNYVPSLAQISKGALLGIRRKREEQSM